MCCVLHIDWSGCCRLQWRRWCGDVVTRVVRAPPFSCKHYACACTALLLYSFPTLFTNRWLACLPPPSLLHPPPPQPTSLTRLLHHRRPRSISVHCAGNDLRLHRNLSVLGGHLLRHMAVRAPLLPGLSQLPVCVPVFHRDTKHNR